MRTVIHGYSDDLIEFEGDTEAEFEYVAEGDGEGCVLALGDGTVLNVLYGEDGRWHFGMDKVGPTTTAVVHVRSSTQDDLPWNAEGYRIPGYSDAVVLEHQLPLGQAIVAWPSRVHPLKTVEQ